MKACCPNCGQIGDLMQFVNEGDARKTMKMALHWPAPLADALVRYLQLFQPKERALAWSRAHRLMQQLHTDIERGYIERRGRTWAAPQPAWKTALQTVVNQRDTLTLPLRDHAYLYEVLCRAANTEEAHAEQRVETERRQRRDRKPSMTGGPNLPPKSQSAQLPEGGLKAAVAAEGQRLREQAHANEGGDQ